MILKTVPDVRNNRKELYLTEGCLTNEQMCVKRS